MTLSLTGELASRGRESMEKRGGTAWIALKLTETDWSNCRRLRDTTARGAVSTSVARSGCGDSAREPPDCSTSSRSSSARPRSTSSTA